MDTGIASIISAGITALTTVIKELISNPNKYSLTGPASSSHFSEAVFDWMNLSKSARKKLGQSKFIRIGGTRDALMELINSATKNDSLLAICGFKGNYSRLYYEKNFQMCKAVKRVFSYEAMFGEINIKKEHFALDGLNMHLDEEEADLCDVQVFLIPEGKYIKDMGGENFDPPLSFGLAILQKGDGSPKKAVVHWEVDAKHLKHLIAIEGVIIDDRQEELLNRLVKWHESIAPSDPVLSSKNKKERELIIDACDKLEKFWKSQRNDKEGGKE